VMLLGNYIAAHRFVTEDVAPEIRAGEPGCLAAPFGAWAILGNHDWWYGVGNVRRAFEKVGIPRKPAILLGEGIAGRADQLAHRLGRGRIRGEANWATLVENRVVALPSAIYHSVDTLGSVSVLALRADRRVPSVRQFRPAVRRFAVEFPGWICEGDEAPRKLRAANWPKRLPGDPGLPRPRGDRPGESKTLLRSYSYCCCSTLRRR
jgi:hypothetical protein